VRGDLNPHSGEISPDLGLNSKTGEKSPDRGVHAVRVDGQPRFTSSGFRRDWRRSQAVGPYRREITLGHPRASASYTEAVGRHWGAVRRLTSWTAVAG
jgi:hypothetical protein